MLLSLQVIEDSTGVRRVVVTPQSPECFPPSYPSAISPTHHLPPYLTHHPHFIHNSHTAFYPPVTGPGDMPPQFFPQHHLPPTIYGEQGELGLTFHTCVQQGLGAGGSKTRNEVENLENFVTRKKPPLISLERGCNYPEYPFLFCQQRKNCLGHDTFKVHTQSEAQKRIELYKKSEIL